jgi:hypothetical protein
MNEQSIPDSALVKVVEREYADTTRSAIFRRRLAVLLPLLQRMTAGEASKLSGLSERRRVDRVLEEDVIQLDLDVRDNRQRRARGGQPRNAGAVNDGGVGKDKVIRCLGLKLSGTLLS